MLSSANFLAIHWVQTLPISNPNRDRTGAPKTTYYGGSMRGRISSQSWSRQVREVFNDKWEGDAGDRSRLWADRLAQELTNQLGYERTDALTTSFLMLSATGAKVKVAGKGKQAKAEAFNAGQTDTLLFLSGNELSEMVAIAHKHKPQLDQILEILRDGVVKALESGQAPSLPKLGTSGKKGKKQTQKDSGPQLPDTKEILKEIVEKIVNQREAAAADQSLFGRFLASLSDANIDGAMTRGHMVTTHTVAVETDFWTAMDDLGRTSDEEEDDGAGAGAGHLGDRPQTSGVYACSCAIDLGQLKTNLGEDGAIKKVLETFIPALITASRGKGYIHQFHHCSLPSLVIAELTESCPLNCVAAFEKPIPIGKNTGYLIPSIKELDAWWHSQHSLLEGLVDTKTWAVVEPAVKEHVKHLQPNLVDNYKALLDQMLDNLEE